MNKNIDTKTVSDFGEEWHKFDQSSLSKEEREKIFSTYFSLFPWNDLPKNPVGFDLGCGSGRWALLVAPKVKTLHCVDPSFKALQVAKKNLKNQSNIIFHESSVEDFKLKPNSMDFGYSLGVLHHVPDTQKGINSCVEKLKSGAPFLIYLYYALDNRPWWFKCIFAGVNAVRFGVSRLPRFLKNFVCETIAVLVYWPLARFAKLLEKVGFKNVQHIPLSFYRHKSFYVMQTDALDRFGTRLEQRFTKEQIKTMLETAGLTDIKFRDEEPYWCAIGFKK